MVYQVITDCNSTTGWNTSGESGNVVLNTSIFKSAGSSLEIPKTGGAGTTAKWSNTGLGTFDLTTHRKIGLWIYVRDATMLAKLTSTDNLKITAGDGAPNKYNFNLTINSVGWTKLVMDIDAPTSTTGTPTDTEIDEFNMTITAANAGDTWSGSELLMDRWHLLDFVGGSGTKEIATRYPVTSGLELADKHEGRKMNLVPTKGSLVRRDFKRGFL